MPTYTRNYIEGLIVAKRAEIEANLIAANEKFVTSNAGIAAVKSEIEGLPGFDPETDLSALESLDVGPPDTSEIEDQISPSDLVEAIMELVDRVANLEVKVTTLEGFHV